MYSTILAALLAAPAQPPAPPEDPNPLYKSLLDTGVTVGAGKVKLPAPTMPDGLSGAKQTEIIKGLIAGQYDYDEFTRKAVVAPQVLKIGDTKPADPTAPGRTVDVWFVAHGDFKLLEDDKFLEKLTGTNKGGGGKTVPLTPADLAKRTITIPKANQNREAYGHVEFDFLEKVRLEATGHAMWSRNAESAVAAAEIDPRFLNDAEFPNRWRSITKEAGAVKVGEPHPWTGAAVYLKVTKLQEPAGALFIEQHIIYSEPAGWFGGANLLGSKLPIAVQDNVRTIRREFQKGK
jgi:hypothetical protein